VLQALACRRRYRLMVICNGPEFRWPGIEMEWRRWNATNEVEDLLQFDVGLMPQPNEEWAKGKCGCKALQYMAVGIPPVASRNGMLPEIIEDGRSGLLATTHDDWLRCLERLMDDPALRASLGNRGKAAVRERYSARTQVPRVAEIFRRAAESRA
jgi:glycosyltransferase involved in cell wall biosynthesis